MGMPNKVREAYERNDYEAIRRMREKAARTRAENRRRKEEQDKLVLARRREYLAEEKRRDEEQMAEEWYRERDEFESFLVSRQRHDHLLPEDEQVPF